MYCICAHISVGNGSAKPCQVFLLDSLDAFIPSNPPLFRPKSALIASLSFQIRRPFRPNVTVCRFAIIANIAHIYAYAQYKEAIKKIKKIKKRG